MKKVVVFSGAGMSAESGLKTFRDSGGLWEEFDIYEVATPEAWLANPALVLSFYNMRRKQVLESEPNAAHFSIAKLEEQFEVSVITQNIDDLHERAGSTNVLHLHGEILKVRGESFPEQLYDSKNDLEIGDLCPNGSQLRPHVVWFGEAVTEIPKAALIMQQAEIVLIIGTSLNVYPAAGLVQYAPSDASFFLVDPSEVATPSLKNLTLVQNTAVKGVPKIVEELMGRVKSI